MLAIYEQLPQIADIQVNIEKHKLYSHIAAMIAKIPAGKRRQIADDKRDSGTGQQ